MATPGVSSVPSVVADASSARRLRAGVLVVALLLGLVGWASPAGAAPGGGTATGSASTRTHEATFTVRSLRDGPDLGAVRLLASVSGSSVSSTVAGTITVPAGAARLQSCVGAIPAAEDAPTACVTRDVAAGASRTQTVPAVEHVVPLPATGLLVIGFVSVQQRIDGAWTNVASSWPAKGWPTVHVPGNTVDGVVDQPAPLAVSTERPAGPHQLVATLSGSGRVRLGVDGRRVGEFTLSADRFVVSVPVHLAGPDDTISIEPLQGASAIVHDLDLTAADPTFTVQGATILDATGEPTVPRGVNRTGLNQTADPQHLDEADFQAMRSWGVDTVRLKLGQHLWLTTSCHHDARYVAAVDRAVDVITDLGMVALLDLAWTTAGDDCGNPGLRMAPDARSVTFWEQVAARYADEPLVAFGLFNEPHHVSRDVWRDGGRVTTPWSRQTFVAVGMQDLYDAVRGTGARNLVYVSGIDYAHDLRPAQSHPLDGYGIVYSAHMYCHGCSELPPIVERGVEPVVGDHPVVVTEFGTTDDDPIFLERVIDWAHERGLGWQAFMWAPRTQGAYGLLGNWRYVPSAAGGVVWQGLQQDV